MRVFSRRLMVLFQNPIFGSLLKAPAADGILFEISASKLLSAVKTLPRYLNTRLAIQVIWLDPYGMMHQDLIR